MNEAGRIFWKTFIANSKERQRGGFICRREQSTASEKKNLFFPPPPTDSQEITVAWCPSCARTYSAQVLNGHLRYRSVHNL